MKFDGTPLGNELVNVSQSTKVTPPAVLAAFDGAEQAYFGRGVADRADCWSD
ncbi:MULTISPECIES: hypothetical protein [unclassified Burkholderia]|uniref:hypothetical protein n=1 Tax=unclassified Burkholderia TaxID=2613784 RepID=UPI00141EB703|nr:MULTISPECIES: hypothetical protein [unclassified Burkholderia]